MARARMALGIALVITAVGYQAGCGGDEPSGSSSVASATSASSAGSGGGDSGSGSGGGGVGGGGGGQGGEGGAFTPMCIDTGGPVFAITTMFFGDKKPDGTADVNAWKKLGFNVDGLVSTAASVDVCKPSSGGKAADAYPDGDNGIDNSFGKNVVPIFKQLDKTFTESTDQNIKDGKFTVLFRMDDLGADPDAPPFVTKLYVGANLGAPPKLDGSDCWPVIEAVLSDIKDIDSAKIQFDASSVAANQWTSGAPAKVLLTLPAAGGTLDLTIREARVSMLLDADHKGAIGGQIGGVLDTEEFIVQIKKVAGTVSPVLCSGPVIDGILKQVRQASDIMKDGKQDPSAVCDGISIGLGFQAKGLMLGGIAPTSPPEPDPCEN